MKKYHLSLIVLFVGLVITSCKPKIESEETSAGDVDATRFIVIGGSEMGGIMDDALYNDGQQHSLGALLSKQLEAIGGSLLNQNLMPTSSEGFSVLGNSRLKLGYKTDCLNVTSLSPIRAASSGDGAGFSFNGYSSTSPYTNFGIPYLKSSGKNHIITTAVEHKSVLNPVMDLERQGFFSLYITTIFFAQVTCRSVSFQAVLQLYSCTFVIFLGHVPFMY